MIVGIFGGGTVGGGIATILQDRAALFEQISGRPIEIKKICVRNLSKTRDFTLPSTTELTTNYDDILNDPSIDTIIEVMGGTTDAKDIVMKAIKSGKNVVTANKALIADSLGEIDATLKQFPGSEFRYEAAVCGGIPIISSLQGDYVGDQINMISGIINGCTNFMLTAMDRDKKEYSEALEEASVLGYAEADPTLDVGGFDARSKLKILMRLAYGVDVEEDKIGCVGIQELTKIDFEYAKMLGGTIKLMGVSKRLPGNKVAAFVSPTYVRDDDTLASVSGATNAIEVLSDNLVQSTYTGQGAGRFPTANSCINDILKIAKGDTTSLPFNAPTDLTYVEDYLSKFYLRLKYKDSLGITKNCGEICEKHGISIHSMLQNPVRGEERAAFAIITEGVLRSDLSKFCSDIEKFDWCDGAVFVMPILRDDSV
ncbi:hypothetical protein ScalyP_jg149 [Parmales sp. scaly parma]|nr:hypothetical protein ScalyP_jg149 [Parmales sp. scaly parma]